MQEFSSYIELIRSFKDEQEVREYFASIRWPDGVPTCPYCEHEGAYVIENGARYKCKCCRKKYSVKVGTIFEGSKLTLLQWVAALWLVANHKKGISAIQLGKDIGCTEKSARFAIHRINTMLREDCPHFIATDVDEEGNTITVPKEIDEKYYGPRGHWQHKDKRGPQGRSTVNKTPILGIMDRKGQVYTEVVADTQARTILPIIRKVVEPGATIYTDEYGPYKALAADYDHDCVQHNKGEYAQGEVHSQTIECFWSQLRGIKGVNHQVSPKHLHRYVGAYEYRWNTRKMNDSGRINLAIRQGEGKRLKYCDLL